MMIRRAIDVTPLAFDIFRWLLFAATPPLFTYALMRQMPLMTTPLYATRYAAASMPHIDCQRSSAMMLYDLFAADTFAIIDLMLFAFAMSSAVTFQMMIVALTLLHILIADYAAFTATPIFAADAYAESATPADAARCRFTIADT